MEKNREIQKKLIQKLVREAKREQELKMNKEIKESDNKGKLIWKFMDRIRGKRRVTEEDVIFEDGKKMGKGKANKAFFDGWKGVLTISKNDSDEIWDGDIKKGMEEKMESNLSWDIGIKEHLGMDHRVEERVGHMSYEGLDESGMVRLTEKLKLKKAPGPDNLPAEVYKGLIKDEVCMGVMLECLNGIMEAED